MPSQPNERQGPRVVGRTRDGIAVVLMWELVRVGPRYVAVFSVLPEAMLKECQTAVGLAAVGFRAASSRCTLWPWDYRVVAAFDCLVAWRDQVDGETEGGEVDPDQSGHPTWSRPTT